MEGNTCAMVITNGYYTRVTPMADRKDSARALEEMEKDIGSPEKLITDLAPELSGKHTEWMKTIRKYDIDLTWSEKGRKNQNHAAEREIGILKGRWKRQKTEKNIPERLWDRSLVYESKVLQPISRGNGQRPGLEQVTGRTPDISEYCDFGFYDLVWYYPGSGVKLDTVDDTRKLGRWMGVSHRVGSDMCYWILTVSGKLISNTSVQHVIRTEYESPATKALIKEFNEKLSERLAVDNFILPEVPETLYIEDEPEEQPEYRRGITPEEAEYGDTFGKPAMEVDDMRFRRSN